MNDIAIVGIGCRFPGARDSQAYWKLLLGAERQFAPVPEDRWNHATFHEPGDRGAPDAAYTDQVAFLDAVDRFDAAHYSLPPRRVEAMDPQHRLMLDVTREALDDAGLGRGGFDRETTGVFFGLSVSDYKERMTARLRALCLADGSLGAPADPGLLRALKGRALEHLGPVEAFTLPGSLLNMAPATVSRHFGLGGPSLAVDAACSSSLVALDQAVHHLRQGTCGTAVVGGVYLSLTPDSLVGFARLGALSADGVCRPFDQRADGFVLGEGAGAVVVRPLRDALAHGDRVYAVIKGIGSANDGTAPGPLCPTPEGQLRAMRRAYADAGVPPSAVGFIEAHGTGTSVGDRVEVEALRRLRTGHPDGQPDGNRPCYLSSGKALIGHALSAAGIAGLIRTALVVHHRTVVPQPDTDPHPGLGLDAAGLRIAATARPWPDGDTPRCAAVSSFGFGGTNVHVVLQEAPAPAPGRRPQPTRPEPEPQLALISAGGPERLREHIDELLQALEHAPTPSMAALAHTLGGRAPLRSRLAIVAADPAEFTERLRRARRRLADGAWGDLGDGAFAAEAPRPAGERRVALLFPGQGSQRPGMLRDLHERFPGFRRTVGALGAAAGVDVAGLLYGAKAGGADEDEAEARRRLAATEVCQPLLGTVQIAATRLLAACGVAPDLVLGHSVGEFAAAAAAGVLTGKETVRLLAHRGALLRAAEAEPRGGMLAVQADEDTCRRLVRGVDGVWLASFNQPRQVVLSGALEGLDAIRRACAEAGIAATALEVSNAFHSPRMASADDAMRTDLGRRPLAAPRLPFVSSVSGTVCGEPEPLRELWSRHASAPVRFGDAVRSAYDAGARVFLQVSGGGCLLTSVRRNLAGRADVHAVAVDGTAPDEGRTFLRALARLAVLGVPVDPRPAVREEDRRLLDLPVARLDTRSYWLRRPDPGSRLRALPTPTDPTEPTNPTAPIHDLTKEFPMRELLDLMRQQVAVLSRLSETLPAVPTAPPRATPGSADGSSPPGTGPDTGIENAVLGQIARISAFPVDHLRSDQLLVEDLGFDSLMLTDLFTSLKGRWPALRIDERCARPTVAGVTAMITDSAGTAEPLPSPDATRIECFPEVTTHQERMRTLGRLRLPNPYLLIHEAGMTDRTVVGGRELISFSGYNYLGLAAHPTVHEAVKKAVDRYGTSASASRLLSGTRPLHQDLESELARTLGSEDAITMTSGHATNVTVIGHLVGPGDLIVHDALAHDSILQGCKLSGATRRPFPHNDATALDTLLTRIRHQYRRVLVVAEGVYSMDGDIADLPALVAVKRRHGALLMVDEAHSIGVLGAGGRGVGEHFGVERADVDLWMGTLSKSLAGCGGYVAADRAVVDYLRYTAPGFVYSAGMTPADAAASLAALRLMRAEPERLARLGENAALFVRLARRAGVDTGSSEGTPIVPCVVGDSAKTLRLARALFEQGVSVNPILHPAVPEELARLRFFLTCEHTPEQIRYTVAALERQLRAVGGADIAPAA